MPKRLLRSYARRKRTRITHLCIDPFLFVLCVVCILIVFVLGDCVIVVFVWCLLCICVCLHVWEPVICLHARACGCASASACAC
jgi:uncharacterized membrane protein